MQSGVWALLTILMAILVANMKTTKPRPVSQMPVPSPEVLEFVRERKMIAAIKSYRHGVPSTLLEAKQVVDHYSAMSD